MLLQAARPGSWSRLVCRRQPKSGGARLSRFKLRYHAEHGLMPLCNARAFRQTSAYWCEDWKQQRGALNSCCASYLQ